MTSLTRDSHHLVSEALPKESGRWSRRLILKYSKGKERFLVFQILLILHILAVCCWLGGAMYERFFIVGGVKRAKGTELEIPMIKLMLSTAAFFLTSVMLIFVTGLIMTIMSGYGILDWSWVGVKQYIFLLIILTFFIIIGPRMSLIGKQIKVAKEQGKGVDDATRALIRRIVIIFDIMHVGVLINIILAVTKQF